MSRSGVDMNQMSDAEKRALRKKGEAAVLHLMEMFPEKEVDTIVEAVKRCLFSLSDATQFLFDNPDFVAPKKMKEEAGQPKEEQKKSAPTLIIEYNRGGDGEKKVGRKEEKKEEKKEGKKEEEKKEEEKIVMPKKQKNFNDEIRQILDVLPNVPREVALDTLRELKGDVERAIEQLLEAFPPVDDDVLSASREIENRRRLLTSSGSVVKVDEVLLDLNKIDFDPATMEDDYVEEDFGDPSFIVSTEIPVNQSDLDDIDLDESLDDLNTDEVTSWFVDPRAPITEEEKRAMAPKEADVFTQMLQLKADEELARELAREENRRANQYHHDYLRPGASPPDSTRVYYNDLASAQSRVSASRKAAHRPAEVKVAPPVQLPKVIERDPALQEFFDSLKQTELRQVLGLNAAPAINPHTGKVAAKDVPLRLVLQELRRVKERMSLNLVKAPQPGPNASSSSSSSSGAPTAPSEADKAFWQLPPLDQIDQNLHLRSADAYHRLQQEEIDNLRALFADDLTESSSFPRRIGLRLNVPDLAVSFPRDPALSLLVVFHPHSPDLLPTFSIRSSALHAPLASDSIAEFEAFLNRKAVAYRGQAMVSMIRDLAVEWLRRAPLVLRDAAEARKKLVEIDHSNDFGESLKTIMKSEFFPLGADEILIDRVREMDFARGKLPEVTSVNVLALLAHFKWNTKEMVKEYRARETAGSLDELYDKLKLERDAAANHGAWALKSAQLAQLRHECPSCLEEFGVQDMCTLPCAHLYCNKCIADYLRIQIKEGVAAALPCPGYKCARLLDETTIASLIDQPLYTKYVDFTSKAYVERNSHLKWCPAKNCDTAIKKIGLAQGMVMCRCGHVWCFKCQKDGHWPATCEQYKWWVDMYAKDEYDPKKKISQKELKMTFDSEAEARSVQWLMAYTQDCPKCGSPIEKNGGCNHMSCKKCSYQYCWVCHSLWDSSHYMCKQRPVDDSDEREGIARRVDSNLTFRQLYLINIRAKRGADITTKHKTLELMNKLVKERPETTFEEIELLCVALEYLFLVRHIIVHICILGKWMQEHHVGGSSALKNETRRLTSGLSYLEAALPLDKPIRKMRDMSDVSLGISAMKESLRSFMVEFTSIWRQNLQPKKEEKKY